MEIPVLSVALIDVLDKEFPLFNPSPDLSEKLIRHRAGQRSVVEMLQTTLEWQVRDQHEKNQMKKK